MPFDEALRRILSAPPAPKIAKKPANIPVESKLPVPKGWWVSLSDEAVLYAASVWKCGNAEAWGRINRAIQDEAISDANPPEQFKAWVELCAKEVM